DRATNLLPDSVLVGTEYLSKIPHAIDTSAANQFAAPRTGRLSLILGDGHQLPAPSTTPKQEASDVSISPEAYTTGPLADNSHPNNHHLPEVDVVFLPWQGPFNWGGVIVAQSKGGNESLAQYRAVLPVVGEKLGVALELEKAETTLGESSER